MTRAYRILNVANKRLPDHDYRIQYRIHTRVAKVIFGLPGKPASLAADEFLELGFGEGLSVADAHYFFCLAKHLRESRNRYDLVHFFSTKLQLFGPLCASLLGISSVSTITGFGRTFNRNELRYRLLRPLYLLVLRVSIWLSEAVFFQNHGDLQWLAKKFPYFRYKMHWVGSGVDAEVVEQKEFSHQPLVVLMVARLMPDKGVGDFLEAARQLQGNRYRFLLAGPPSVGQASLQRQVDRAESLGLIEYLGELDQQSLRLHYQQSHVFAFPSHGEGMPRVMLEAGHALLCPIASDIPAHRDLIHEGAGFLIDKDNRIESLVAHLKAVDQSRALLEQNARAYQQAIVENYSVQAYSNRMDDFITRILGTAERSVSRLRRAA